MGAGRTVEVTAEGKGGENADSAMVAKRRLGKRALLALPEHRAEVDLGVEAGSTSGSLVTATLAIAKVVRFLLR